MSHIELFTVAWRDQSGRIVVEMLADDAKAWQRYGALTATGVDAVVARQGLVVHA